MLILNNKHSAFSDILTIDPKMKTKIYEQYIFNGN